MKKSLIKYLLPFLLLGPLKAMAQQYGTILPDCGQRALTGIPVPCSPLFIGPAGKLTATGVIIAIINIALWIVGLLAVLFVIVGGFRYITAHGNEEQAEAAKKTLLHAIIGIVIVMLSFVIVRVIVNALALGSLGT